ncbi:hypothetical protein RIF29_29904 [Crotalaria pallida]|uniref:Uncharacterized protein n=1 Tax=Crotalaria pallida TaxID=3830 RepID=A0AAN9EFC9_CROPI
MTTASFSSDIDLETTPLTERVYLAPCDDTTKVAIDVQIIDSFADSVMSVCLTKSEIIGGSVDGTVRTYDIRIGRCIGQREKGKGLCNLEKRMLELHQEESCTQSPTVESDE